MTDTESTAEPVSEMEEAPQETEAAPGAPDEAVSESASEDPAISVTEENETAGEAAVAEVESNEEAASEEHEAPVAEVEPVSTEEETAEAAPEIAVAESETVDQAEENAEEAEPVQPAVEAQSTAEVPSAEADTHEVTEEAPETATAEETAADSTVPEAAVDESNEAEAEEEEEEEIIDYSNHTREQLADVVEELSKQDNFKRADAILNQVLPLFKAVERASRQEAKERFLADGGEEDDFEFRHDEVFNKFDASVRLLRDRKASYYKERESRKESNYQHKLEILDKLRELIDGENATTNLSPIKALQEEWKAVGPVPSQHNRTLWANYNALLDRFYNNRHILFELKELDRKKNLVKKQEVCEKAEALDKLENIKDAIVQLNELHEEYKKIGPVPREVQEELWQRFKAASDAIYKKRKSYLDELKGELLVKP